MRSNRIPPVAEAPTPAWMLRGRMAKNPKKVKGQPKTEPYEERKLTYQEKLQDEKSCYAALQAMALTTDSPVPTQFIANWTRISYRRTKKALARLNVQKLNPRVITPKHGMWLVEQD